MAACPERPSTRLTMPMHSLLLVRTSLALLAPSIAGCGGGAPEGTPASQPAAVAGSEAQDGSPTTGDDLMAIEEVYRVIGDAGYPTFAEGADPVQTMRAYIDGIQARPDVKDNSVKVQHILIGVGPRFGGTQPDAAEKRAAEVLQELAAGGGENFDALVEKHTDDAYPGIYTMLLEGRSDYDNGVFLRREMVSAFGDVGWKLQVGEVGISPYDPRPPAGKGTSYFGIHIIKRLE